MVDLQEKIANIANSITLFVPEIKWLETYEKDIYALEEEKKALGLLKTKEKKALQEQIDKLEKGRKNCQDVVNKKIEKHLSKSEPMKSRVNEILVGFGQEPLYKVEGDIIEIKANGDGQIKHFEVEVGDYVNNGDTICWIKKNIVLNIGGIADDRMAVCFKDSIGGKISSIEVKVGEYVKEGQVVATVVQDKFL